MAGREPNPERHTDPTHGLLSKVFIVYPHNPQVYQWVSPEELQRRYPGCSPDELHRIQIDEARQLKLKEKENIEKQDKLVHDFAQFLESRMIAVAYEGLLHDYPTDNYMKWFQKQMKDSDYVMLIITESFCHFLSNEPPQDKERIFVGNFLHNFVHNPSKLILPVFLGRPEHSSLLPDALRASATYHVVAGEEWPFFNIQQPQLDRLYAVLTKQNRITPPAPIGVVPISGLQRRVPIRPPVHQPQFLSNDRHKQMYEYLKCIRRRLTGPDIISLSEKPGFSTQWRLLAERLGFGVAEVERVAAAGHDNAERCYQLLYKWGQMNQEATVMVLAEALCNTVMLELAYSVFRGH